METHYFIHLRIYLANLRKFVENYLKWCLQKLVTWFSALTCIILILWSPWKDAGEEVQINLLLQVLTQRNQNVGKNFYQMMKINILICEEEAFHLHSTDGKNTNSRKVSELKSSQEWTDTRVILYCMYAKQIGYKNFRTRTPDSDIFLYLFALC